MLAAHTRFLPPEGGVAIVVVFLLVLGALFAQGLVAAPVFYALIGAGAGVAVTGFMDDHGHIAARWRLAGHFCAAAWAVYWLQGLPVLDLFGLSVPLGWSGSLLAVVYLVWMLNLYNFMDGIDGIASIEAVCACVGASLLYAWDGQMGLMGLPMLLAAAVGGFLLWNFPPARIFMGDAGSGFLGIILGAFSLQAAHIDSRWFWVWVILLGVFVVDATFTLLRRLTRGDKVYEAHRSHAYQYATRQYGRHLPVTLAVLSINVFWLFPLAFCVIHFGMDGALVTVAAYVPLLFVALRYHAGELETRESGA